MFRLTALVAVFAVALWNLGPAPASASTDQASEKFMYAVCALKGSGSITFGGSEGCTWRGSEVAAGASDDEDIVLAASRGLPPAQLQAAVDAYARSYAELVTNGEGHVWTTPLNICGGGGQKLETDAAIPVVTSYYVCGNNLITLDAHGAKAVSQFDSLATRIVPLLPIE